METNYIDSRTDEQREQDSKIEVQVTSASALEEKDELNEDDAIEREHEPVEYYVEPELPSEHNL